MKRYFECSQIVILVAYLIGVTSQIIESKILIFTPVYNRPDFIEMQDKTFKKFLKDEYDWKIFNDADNPAMEQAINETCQQLGITCIRVPQNLHNVDSRCHKAPASFRHGESVQFAYEQYGFKHDDIVMLIDSDVFLIHEFSVRDFLGDHDLYTIYDLMILQLLFINMPHLKNPETINFRASGEGSSFKDAGHLGSIYINTHPELKIKKGSMIWGVHRGAPADLGLDKNGDIIAQMLGKGYTNSEALLVKNIVDVCAQAIRINPRDTRVFMDCNIGFFEKNTFLDYKHGSAWHGPNASFKAKKDYFVRSFIDSL